MSVTGKLSEQYVSYWYGKQNPPVTFNKKHSKGCDLESTSYELHVEVKGTSEIEFSKFRPYFTLAQLDLAIAKGRNYKIHILLGVDDFGNPNEHWIADGTVFSGYANFVIATKKFLENWKTTSKEQLKPDVTVFLRNLEGFKKI